MPSRFFVKSFLEKIISLTTSQTALPSVPAADEPDGHCTRTSSKSLVRLTLLRLADAELGKAIEGLAMRIADMGAGFGEVLRRTS
jgi:hypothetical protein